jgi:hypothetical protein
MLVQTDDEIFKALHIPGVRSSELQVLDSHTTGGAKDALLVQNQVGLQLEGAQIAAELLATVVPVEAQLPATRTFQRWRLAMQKQVGGCFVHDDILYNYVWEVHPLDYNVIRHLLDPFVIAGNIL